jgi:hypothetical protein
VQLNQHAWVSDIGGGRVSLAQVTLEEDRVLVMKGKFRLLEDADMADIVGIDRCLFCRSTVSSFVDQPSETNTDDEPWNGEK